MRDNIDHTRLLRYAGLFTWAAAGCWLISVWLDPSYVGSFSSTELANFKLSLWRWAAAYLTFGAVYWGLTRSLGGKRWRLLDQVLLVVLTIAAIATSYFSDTGLGSILLMVAAVLLPWLLSLRVALAWLVFSNLAIIPVFIGAIGMPPVVAVIQSLVYVGFSGFVFATSLVARQQSQAREEQRRLNAELRATRALLAESVRVNERTRISRELHDLLGHHLTALSLNLEVAGHLVDGPAREHVVQSHTLAKLLLSDVREVVSQLRDEEAIDMAATLLPLAENVPGLDIDMHLPSPFMVDDPERAHVLLRCTQEIITNAVRHAQATRLQLDYRLDRDTVQLDASDDGRGADQVQAGNGLRGLQERLAAFGGTVSVRTAPDAGFNLQLRLPLRAAADIAGMPALHVSPAPLDIHVLPKPAPVPQELS